MKDRLQREKERRRTGISCPSKHNNTRWKNANANANAPLTTYFSVFVVAFFCFACVVTSSSPLHLVSLFLCPTFPSAVTFTSCLSCFLSFLRHTLHILPDSTLCSVYFCTSLSLFAAFFPSPFPSSFLFPPPFTFDFFLKISLSYL